MSSVTVESLSYNILGMVEYDREIDGKLSRYRDYTLVLSEGLPRFTLREFIRDDCDPTYLMLETYYSEPQGDGEYDRIPWEGSGEAIFGACVGEDGGDPSILQIREESGRLIETFKRIGEATATVRSSLSSEQVFTYADSQNELRYLFVHIDEDAKYIRMLVGNPLQSSVDFIFDEEKVSV